MGRHGPGRLILRGALVLLLPLLIVTEVPLLHTHHGPGSGLYDEECPDLRLATSAGRLGPSPCPLIGIGLLLPGAGSPEVPRPLVVPGIPLGPPDARAPPRSA